jgi:hypothetical protein
MKTQIKVDGNIISELSEKIPTNIIALNELIKNSYDAGASFVTINLDTRKKQLHISDNGSGMNKKDIDGLFIISKSNKNYGQKNEYGRITQGSKGLGFLSVFKFGKSVEWKTNKNKGFSFSVNSDELVSADDISHFPIELIEDNSILKGTEITIDMNDYSIKSLKAYFSIEKNYKKIVNIFDDDNFIVNLEINGKPYQNQKKILLDNEKEQQLFYVTYNSKKQEIIFRHNDYIILTEPYPFPHNQFGLDIELLIFQLKSHGKEKIDKLFFSPNDDLTPLIYFNSNLFNNYAIFDPGVMRNIKTSQVLNQMIGFIRLTSKNKRIDFNSDRSQFLQNELTDNIKDFLLDINKKIQELGSKMKDYLIRLDFLTKNKITSDYFDSNDPEEYRKLINDDFFFKDKVGISVQDNKVVYSIFGRKTTLLINDNISSVSKKGNKKSNSQKSLIPAKIILNRMNEQKITVPSGQLKLKDYVVSVNDSDGKSVVIEKLVIKVDGIENTTGILPSIEARCEKNIEYHYCDLKTGLVIKKMKLVFIEPKSNIITKKTDDILIYIPAGQSYKMKYNQFLDKLIEQIKSLNKREYFEMIACSLRPIFELSIASINQSRKYSGKFNRNLELADKIAEVISYIKNKQDNIREIDKSTTIGFHNLNNMLNVDEFKKAVKNANLGSHQASTYLTESEVEHIAKYASLFIVITNEMLTNAKVT